MRVLIFLLLLPFNSFAQDALLEAMFKDWSIEEVEEDNYLEFPDSSEAEIYHWNLGTPDNIPEIEIIYEDNSPCRMYH
jgi:hypothetical protein